MKSTADIENALKRIRQGATGQPTTCTVTDPFIVLVHKAPSAMTAIGSCRCRWAARCDIRMQEAIVVNLTDTSDARFAVHPYQPADRQAVRIIYGEDEFARPRLLRKYPRMREYLADEASYYYTEYEPESILVAEADGEVVGALLGAVNTPRYKHMYKRHIRPLLVQRCLSGAYGLPVWLLPIVQTELASRTVVAPQVDLRQYPAHLHIGVLPDWRRKGIGASLMAGYEEYLRGKTVAGYHLFASSFHPLGMAFYRKLGLEVLGQFPWRFHNGSEWLTVTEHIFGRRLN